MTDIINLLLTTILIFSNLGLNSQIQGQSPSGTVPLRLGGTNVVTDESGAQVEYVENSGGTVFFALYAFFTAESKKK